MTNVRKIFLHNQQIARIDTHAFHDVPLLHTIILGSNRLPTFPHATFEWRNWPALHTL